MRRTYLLTALFLILGAGAWMALRYQQKNASGSVNSWDMEFAVKNPDEVQKIFYADKKGNTTLLERKEGYWLYNGKYRARATGIELILNTISRMNVRFIPTDAAVPNMVKSLAAEGIKIEIYGRNDAKLKTYYIGGVTQDERGTYAIMEGSEQPYVVHVPSMVGQVRVHFPFGNDDWRDKTIFFEKPEDIKTISVEYPQQRNESFKLTKTGPAAYVVQPFYSTTTPLQREQRKGVAEGYLLQFEKLGAEAFETENIRRDSVTNLIPFAVVTVETEQGATTEARFWPVKIETRADNNQQYIHRYFTLVNGTDFMLTQHVVFGKIFRSYTSFFEGAARKNENIY